MSTKYPTALDDTTTMPVVIDNSTSVLASHHNNQSDALQAVETKLGTGASTATDGKFLVGNTTAGSSQWRTIASTDVPDISGTYAPVAKGVTNGDTHDHSGGDGGQIAYSSLSGTPTIPVKATGTEIDAGTNDAKFATPKAIEDSSVAFTTDKLSNFAATTSAELAGVISDETGSGKLVFDTSPTLVTPTLGVASATSVNKVAITAPTTSATITVADGKTLTASNTVTLTATDGSTLAIGTGGTLGTAAYTAATDYATAAQGSTADNAVPKSLYDANSILYATADDTPLALTVGASTIVGRKSTGDIVALTATETRTILNVADGATANTKATGAEVDTGTDDAKFVTSKAMEDSDYIKSTGNAATATNIANNTGTTTTVLHGNASGAPAFGAVVEADITLSDNTTGDVSITKHGLTPKLSNVAGQFLNGIGGWSAPSGSGDVLGPASNTADYLPQWNGANSKTLKDGVAIPTGGLAGLTSPVFTTPQINDTSADHQYITAVSELTADRTVTLPLLTADDEFIFKTHHADLYGSSSMARQAIINGNFDVWQRGTSVAMTAANAYTADRWYCETATAGTDKTVSREDGTGVNGSYYCARVKMVSDVDELLTFSQALESQDSIKFRGKKVTLSFYARGGAEFVADNPTLVSKIVTGKGTDQKVLAFTTSADGVSQNNTLTTSWVKFTCTTTAVIAANITQIGVSFAFTHAGSGTTTNYFEITQVQLCAGDVALPFMPKSYGEELRACQRYCEFLSGVIGRAISATVATFGFSYKVTKRIAAGTTNVFFITGANALEINTSTRTFTTCDAAYPTVNGGSFDFGGASSMTSPNMVILGSDKVYVDVEL